MENLIPKKPIIELEVLVVKVYPFQVLQGE